MYEGLNFRNFRIYGINCKHHSFSAGCVVLHTPQIGNISGASFLDADSCQPSFLKVQIHELAQELAIVEHRGDLILRYGVSEKCVHAAQC
jgi:hypothetical protein